MPKRDRSRDKNLIGDFTDPELIAQLTGWLESSGAREIEIIAADGQALKIALGAANGARVARKASGIHTTGATGAIKAPAAGRFRDASPAFRKGQKIRQDAIIGFIEIGPVLLPVVAREAGRIGEVHVKAGDLVGYGAVIVTTESVR